MAITVGDVTIRPIPGAAARWRRLGVVATVLLAVILFTVVLVAPNARASQAPSTTPADTWTVAEGETLWAIATAITAPGDDVRDTLDAIKGLNALESSAIRAGEQLLVPALD
jgi:hypothetical protein